MNGVQAAVPRARVRTAAAIRAPRLWWVASAAVLLLAITVQPFRDSDVWWHLAVGRLITTHGIPAQEPFSFLQAAHAWVGQQWLYEVLLYRLVNLGGDGLASLALGILAALAVAVAALSVPHARRIPGAWLAAAMVFSGLVMAEVVGVRGQVISVLGTALVLLVVARWRDGHTRAVWALPPLFLLWANLHAGFIAGFGVLAIALLLARPADRVSEARRTLLLAALLGGVATMVNPAGPSLYGYVAGTFFNPTLTSAITEWASPDFHNMWLRLFEAEAVVLVFLWVLSRGPDAYDVVLGGAAVVATLQAQRNVSLFAIIAVPQIARYGAEAWSLQVAPRLRSRHRDPANAALLGSIATMVITVAVAVTVAPQLSAGSTASFDAARYPVAPADYIATHLARRRLYSIDTWGGYLAYRFPQHRVVFLYGETAVLGNADLQLYEDVHLLRSNWTHVLTSEAIHDAVVPLHSQEASGFHALRWRVDCYDSTSDAVVMSAPTDSTASEPALLSAPISSPRC